MTETIQENFETEVVGSYDVIVIGGGIAGVAASLAVRREGLDVLLIERHIALGGLATLGLIAYYLPLCDGIGRKVTGGIAEELLWLATRYGYHDLPKEWQDGVGSKEKRYAAHYGPFEFAFALDELLQKEKVDVLFDSLFVKPVVSDGTCQAVITENAEGRRAYKAKFFIDATGKAELFWKAGVNCVEHFNYLSFWYLWTDTELMKWAADDLDVSKGVKLEWKGKFEEDGTYTLGEQKYYGKTSRGITNFVLEGRKLLAEKLQHTQRKMGSVIAIPVLPQLRLIRSIKGMYTLDDKDAGRYFDDSVGCAAHWLKRGCVYEVPYRCLIAVGLKNVIAAGRHISAVGDAAEVTRIIPACALTGQAAGTAAALAIKYKKWSSELPVRLLQKRLTENGVILHYKSETKN